MRTLKKTGLGLLAAVVVVMAFACECDKRSSTPKNPTNGPALEASHDSCAVAYSCVTRGGQRCLESPTDKNGQERCERIDGVYNPGPCDRADAVGGCRLATPPECTTNWVFPLTPQTQEELQSLKSQCKQVNGTWVEP